MSKMTLLGHLGEQPFIVATGVAAFAHSTWTLGTWFAGMQPVVTAPMFDGGLNGVWVAQSLHLLFWLLPAAAIAFALDVGQIATSHDIQRGHRSKAKYATFAVFAVATYYLQWLYLAHHMPVVELSAGIRAEMLDFARLMRDVSIWCIPLLLPLSTLLYTFSHADEKHASAQIEQPAAPTHIEQTVIRVNTPHGVQLPPPPSEARLLVFKGDDAPQHAEPVPRGKTSGGGGGNATGDVDASLTRLENGRYQTSCVCGKLFESDDLLGAKRAAAGHRARCKVYKEAQQTSLPKIDSEVEA